jgi:N-acetylglucosaminyl-diphospho-decaprenol L-rhamnosyltransferase
VATVDCLGDPRLSIVVVTYNCIGLLPDLLGSLEKQDTSFDLIIVDNDSKDGTAERARALAPAARVISAATNSGFGCASNAGLHLSTAPFILFLNPDTILGDPSVLGQAVTRLEATSEIGVLGVRLVQKDGQLDRACKRGEPTPSRAVSYYLGLHRLFPRSRLFAGYVAGHIDEHEPAFVDAINGAFMLMRRGLALELGGFDERFWMYAEDLDLCRRVRLLGYKVAYDPRMTVTHLKGKTNGGRRSGRASRAFFESMGLYYRKWYHPLSRHPIAAMCCFGIAIRRKSLSGLDLAS